MAGLVLEEVKHNWSIEESPESLPPGTAIEIGTSIRNAMENWREGLGPLMSALNMLDSGGNIPTLGIDVKEGWVTTGWYREHTNLANVIQLPGDPYGPSKRNLGDWPHSITSRGIEPTRVWPWSITHGDLSDSLSKQLRSYQLALESTVGLHEFAYEFTRYLRRSRSEAEDLQTPTDIIDYFDKWLQILKGDPGSSVSFGYRDYSFTAPELEFLRERFSELSHDGVDILMDPWPAPDKEWPQGKSRGMWFERYTKETLLQRTNAILNGALRIYNDIVERLLSEFNKRNQMRYALPFRMRGELELPEGHEKGRRNSAAFTYWNEWADDTDDSGVFIELGPKERTTGDDTWKRIEEAQKEFAQQGIPIHRGWRMLPGYEPRPATKLALEWLTDDLNALHWARP